MPHVQAKNKAMTCDECRYLLSRYPGPVLVNGPTHMDRLRQHYNTCYYCQEWGAVDRANKPRQEKT